MAIIKFKRGLKENLPLLDAGEPAFTTDTKELFIGDGLTNNQILGTPGPTGPIGPIGQSGPQGATGATGPMPTISGTSNTSLTIGLGIQSLNASPPSLDIGNNQFISLVYDSSHWMCGTVISFNDSVLVADITGMSGNGTFNSWNISLSSAQGPPSTISIGSVSKLPAGSSPVVSNSGTASTAVLNFGIPAGDPGQSALANIDGGNATSNFGGIAAIDLGGSH
jgi:Major tropism determinant N-terminal domain